MQGHTNKGCRIIAAALFQVIGFAKSIFTDTSLSDKQVSAGIEFQLLIQFLLYVFDIHFPVCTYAYEVECTKHGIIDFLFLKIKTH